MYARGFIMLQPRASAIPLKAASATRIAKERAMVGQLSTLVIMLVFTKTAPSFKHAYPDTAHAIACRSHDPQISRETHWASRLDHRKSDKGMVP
jgi:hypothetical protein